MGIFYVPCKFKVIRGIQYSHNIGSKTNLDNNILHLSYWIYVVVKSRLQAFKNADW